MKSNSLTRQFFFTTVRVESTAEDGTRSSGTAFFYNASRTNRVAPFLVTNKHVVRGARGGRVFFLEGNEDGPVLGSSVLGNFGNFEGHWVFHPNEDVDLCCLAVADVIQASMDGGHPVFFKSVNSDLCPSPADVVDLEAIEDVTFIGYPSALYDTVNLTPIVRSGRTATPIELDFNGLPAFLIDASVFPGSSGSPVFIVQRGGYIKGGSFQVGRDRAFFVGVVASVHVSPTTGQLIQVINDSGVVFNSPIDLGVVFNWKAVEELIDEACRLREVDRDSLK